MGIFKLTEIGDKMLNPVDDSLTRTNLNKKCDPNYDEQL